MQKTEFISRAIEFLRCESKPGQLITAAKIGMLLRREFNGPLWKEVGFTSLKEFLTSAEKLGLLQVGESEQGALAAAIIQPVASKGTESSDALRPAESFEKAESLDENAAIQRPLHSAFWRAFALDNPPGRRFLNKTTGEVRLGQRENPDTEESWIEIEPISIDIQRDWAGQFWEKKELGDAAPLKEVFQSSQWYTLFPNLLRSHSEDLVSEWNRHRSSKVARHVFRWAKGNKVNPEFAFTSRGSSASRLIKSKNVSTELESISDAQMRKFILQAISQAPIDWLMDIPIPAKYLFRAISKNPTRY